MLVALYARVSKPSKNEKEEKDKVQTVDTQLYPLREFVKNRGWKVFREYTEEISAVKQRPQLELMLNDAFQHKFDIVIVWAVDRLARSTSDFVRIVDKLMSCDVGFMSTSQNIDTKSEDPFAKAMREMLGIFASLERSMIVGRVKAGISRAKAQGVRFGREPKEFDAAEASKLIMGGMSLRKVAKAMGVKKSFLYGRLTKYKGTSGVYAVRFRRNGIIKIGSCNNLNTRIAFLQGHRVDSLDVLAFAPEQVLANRAKREELAIHKQLPSSSRCSGREWYLPTKEVKDVVFKLREKTPEELLTLSDTDVMALMEKYTEQDPLDIELGDAAIKEFREKLENNL